MVVPNFIVVITTIDSIVFQVSTKWEKTINWLHPVSVVAPWYHIGIDFVGPISPKSLHYILTISDYFTKFVEGIPLPNKFASSVAASVYKVS